MSKPSETFEIDNSMQSFSTKEALKLRNYDKVILDAAIRQLGDYEALLQMSQSADNSFAILCSLVFSNAVSKALPQIPSQAPTTPSKSGYKVADIVKLIEKANNTKSALSSNSTLEEKEMFLQVAGGHLSTILSDGSLEALNAVKEVSTSIIDNKIMKVTAMLLEGRCKTAGRKGSDTLITSAKEYWSALKLYLTSNVEGEDEVAVEQQLYNMVYKGDCSVTDLFADVISLCERGGIAPLKSVKIMLQMIKKSPALSFSTINAISDLEDGEKEEIKLLSSNRISNPEELTPAVIILNRIIQGVTSRSKTERGIEWPTITTIRDNKRKAEEDIIDAHKIFY